MPTIDVNRKDLNKLIGKKLTDAKLEEALMFVKGEIDGIEAGVLKIDVKETNRPELWSVEGIAREIRTRIGLDKGLKKYKLNKSGLKVKIEKSVKQARPLTVSAVVKNIKITEELLTQLIQLQEKVDGTFGRKRKESSTGIYDFDKIKGNITYYGAEPLKTKFTPLEFKTEMDLDEILKMHPKGKEYGKLLKGQKKYPIFKDEEENILSMPPIINSNYSGRVTKETKNLFIEVSGFDFETIHTGLKVIVMALADRGGKIETVEITDANGKKFITPEFKTKKMKIEIDYINKITGLGLKPKEIIDLLKKAGMDAKIQKEKIKVIYQDYRRDIIHPIDIIEDILIGYGYNDIKPLNVEMSVVGEEDKESLFVDKARDVCVGLGLQEIVSFILTSKEKQSTKLGLTENEELVEIANPVSLEWTVMRKKIFPELLEFLTKNKRYEYPQKIFEIGKTIEPFKGTETGVRENNSVCVILTEKNVDFNLIKSNLNALTENLGLKYELIKKDLPFLEKGLSAEVIIKGKKGFIGKLSTKTMQEFGLETPVVIFEINI